MKYKLLIFDWDGTLADSAQHIVECIKVACEATDETFPGREAAKNIIGLGMREALTELFGERDDDFAQAFRGAYSSHFFSSPPTRADLFPGIIEVLEEFRALGYRLAIATGKSRRGISLSLQGMQLESWFDAVRCADETCSKPDPLMLRELLEEFDLASEQALMIGDTEYDMDMAKRVNMPRIAVSYGAHDIERMRIYEPEGIANQPSDLVEMIDNLVL